MTVRALHDQLNDLLKKQGAAAQAKPPEMPRKMAHRAVPLESHYKRLGEQMDMDPYVIQLIMKHANITENAMLLHAFKRFLMTARTVLDEDELPVSKELAKVAQVQEENDQIDRDHLRDLRHYKISISRINKEKTTTLDQLQAAWQQQWDQLVPVLQRKPPKGVYREYTQLNGNQLALWVGIRDTFSEHNPHNTKHVEKIRRASPEQIQRINRGLVDRHRAWIRDQLIDDNAIRERLLQHADRVINDIVDQLPYRKRLNDTRWDRRAAADWMDSYARQYNKMAESMLAQMETSQRRTDLNKNAPRLRDLHRKGVPGYEELHEHLWEQWCNQITMHHFYDDSVYHAVQNRLNEQEFGEEFSEEDLDYIGRTREW